MPRYRAWIEFTDDEGRERVETVEVNARSDSAEDLALAAQEAWGGFAQDDDLRMPHNIRWELLEEEV